MRSAAMTMAACAAALSTLVVGGCGIAPSEYTTEERMANGLVVILPGIEGVSRLNRDIRQGIASAGCNQALAIYAWGRPVPGVGMILNQMDFVGNRLAGAEIARMIANYQDSHPGRPVHIVGHSGGGGVAVFAAERMPEGHKIDGLILLSASIWHGYDLTKALRNTRQGIVNFYNPDDSGLLAVGTTVTSNVDGMRGPSAGLNGFDKTYPRLYQVRIAAYGSDPHTAVTQPGYVSTYIAPWVLSSAWPATATAKAADTGEDYALKK